jgi:hypothetical protein
MSIAARRSLIAVVALLLAWRVLQVNVALDDNGRPRFGDRRKCAAGEDCDALRQVLRSNPGQVEARCSCWRRSTRGR